MQLRRHSAIPLYRQMESALLSQIDSGELQPGDRLPPETELARRWNVNRLTVRQAIGGLARAGRLTVRRGAGTYVAEPALLVEVDLPPLPMTEAEISSSAAFEAQGHRLREEVTGIDADCCAGAVAALKVADLTRVETVHNDGDSPWFVSSHWLPTSRFPDIVDAFAGGASLYEALRDRYGVRLRYSWRSLVAAAASSADAEILDVPPGSPVMLREGLNVDDAGTPTVFIRRRMRGDRIKYMLRYDTA